MAQKKYCDLTEDERQKRCAAMRKYYHNNKEKIKARNRECRERLGKTWKSCDPEHKREILQKNRRKLKGDPERYSAHLEKRRLWAREQRTNNPEKVRSAWNRWREAHKERYNKQKREYISSPSVKTKTQRYRLEHRLRYREVVLQAYGGCCVCCGENHGAFLTLDHINNDGRDKRRNKEHPRGGISFYKWVIEHKFPSDLQLLCWNCNCAKYFFGTCPHQAIAGELLGTRRVA